MKSMTARNANKDAGDSNSKEDISQIRTPIQISGKPVEQVLNSVHYGSPELRCLLMDECDLIFECKVCRALFRDLPNFISHKRTYCTKSSAEDRHVAVASLPEEKVVVIQPQAPEDTEQESGPQSRAAAPQQKSSRPNLEETIQRIQSGELGQSHAYKVYTEAAEKLQRQKEGMRVATIRTTPIPTNKNAMFIDVNMTSVNIHERQQVNNSSSVSYDMDKSLTVIKRKAGEKSNKATPRPSRPVRKIIEEEKDSSEPQKRLMEQLKEIQHKVKQKAAAQDRGTQKGKEKNTPQTSNTKRETMASQSKTNSHKTGANAGTQTNTVSRKFTDSGTNNAHVERKAADSFDFKDLARQNFQTALAKAEIKSSGKEVGAVVTRRRDDRKEKISSKVTVHRSQSHTAKAVKMAKSSKRYSSKKSLICSKCNSIFATRKSLHFHNKIHHSTKRTFYPCPYCSSEFYYFFGITRHLFNSHSKTMDEIDKMRKLLREKSYVKPVFPKSPNKEIKHVVGTRRSARTVVHTQVSKSPPISSATANVSSGDKESSNTTRRGKISESPASGSSSRSLKSKSGQPDGEQLLLSKSGRSGTGIKARGTDERKTEDSQKENSADSRAERLRNRQQQKASGDVHEQQISEDAPDASLELLTPTPSPAPSSAVSEESHESSSYVCPKCKRSFGRKISHENHLKVCEGEGSDSSNLVKSERSQVSQASDVKDSKPANRVQSIGKSNTSDAVIQTGERGLVASDLTRTPKVMSIDPRGRSRDGSNDSRRSTSSRNSATSSADRAANQSLRSASVDRGVRRDESRNRSLERTRASRDRRDSSVESTQSNVEGANSRGRRNVLSRYASSAAQTASSPVKSNLSPSGGAATGSDSTKADKQSPSPVTTRGRKLDVNGPSPKSGLPHTGREQESKSRSPASGSSQAANASSDMTQPRRANVVKSTGSGKHTAAAIHSKITSRNDRKQAAGLPPKTYFSPRIQQNSHHGTLTPIQPPKSHHKLPTVSRSTSISPRKQLSPMRRLSSPGKHPISPQGSLTRSSNPDLSTNKISSSQIKTAISGSAESLKNKLASKGEAITKPKTKSIDDVKREMIVDTEKQSTNSELLVKTEVANTEEYDTSEKQETHTGHPKVFTSNQDEKIKEVGKDYEQMQTDLTSSTSSCKIDPKVEVADEKISQGSPNQQVLIKNNASNNFDGDQLESTPRAAVISALSERPKRKRKVPSRNKDAEEMFSKIHNLNREAVPEKKAKIMPEHPKTKASHGKSLLDTSYSSSSSANMDASVSEMMEDSEDNDQDKDLGSDVLSSQDEDKDEDEEEGEEEDGHEETKGKGRNVNNRVYVLENSGKGKRLRCYDQSRVYKLIDEKRLRCLICGESCSQVYNIRRHVIRQHLKWSRFKCKLCKFECYDRSECTTHILRSHRDKSIRSVNPLIIDLVKQGSRARSLKKTQTIRVKQQSESEAGNIYARPMVKRVPRLPHRVKDESSSGQNSQAILHKGEGSEQKHTRVKEGGSTQDGQLADLGDQCSSMPVSPKQGLSPKSGLPCQSVSPKSDLLTTKPMTGATEPAPDGKDPTFKASARKSLPFNISTRNSPRTFDISPYNAENDNTDGGGTVEQNPDQSKEQVDVQNKSVFALNAMNRERSSKGRFKRIKRDVPTVSQSQRSTEEGEGEEDDNNDEDSHDQGIKVSHDTAAVTVKQTVTHSRNIFDNMRRQSVSSVSSDVSSVDGDNSSNRPRSRHSSSLDQTAEVCEDVANQQGKVMERQDVESILVVKDSDKSQHGAPSSVYSPISSVVILSQPPGTSSVVAYPKVLKLPEDATSSDLLARSLLKLKKIGDQLTSSSSSPSTSMSQVFRTASTSTTLSASTARPVVQQPDTESNTVTPVISVSTRKTTAAELSGESTTPTSSVLTQEITTSKSLATPASTSSSAITSKEGQPTTTSSFILNHGQAGKIIVYSRPADEKFSSVSSSSSSPLPSTTSSVSTITVKPKDTGGETPSRNSGGKTKEDVLPAGTFVIHQHYI